MVRKEASDIKQGVGVGLSFVFRLDEVSRST